MLIFSSFISGHVTAVQFASLGSFVETEWKLEGTVDDRKFGSRGVCDDLDGRVYIADMNSRIIALDMETGRPIQTLLDTAGLGPILDVCWLNNPKQLFVKHSFGNGASIYELMTDSPIL